MLAETEQENLSVADDPLGMFTDDKAKQEQQLQEIVSRVHAGMVGMRDEWVRYRAQSGVEERWRKANALYHGDTSRQEREFVEQLKSGPLKRTPQQQRSRIVVNIVRPKVDQAVARQCEILLPTDGQNFGLKNTPIPDAIQKMLGDMRPTVIPGTNVQTGLTAHEEATAYLAAAREAAEGMEKAIADSLAECRYNAEQRKVIEDGTRLGTGIIFGPVPTMQHARAWLYNGGRHELVVKAEVKPASVRYDPWDVWFDPACGNDHQRGQGVWTLRRATRRELRALVGTPGFSEDAIRKVLMTAPTRVTVAEGRVTRTFCREDTYEVWTYHGDVEPDQMTLCSLGNNGDPLLDVEFGVVVMVQDTIIGAMESWVKDRTIPCDVWCWRKSDDSPYGYGLPHELEHQQAVVIAAWRQVMDNARTATGGQIVFNNKITPTNNSMEITPNKTWYAADDVQDVSKAFAVFQFNAHVQELMGIATAAMQMADQESSMPQMLGGEQGDNTPETLGGMMMAFSNASAVLRMRCKLYDDGITVPHITRYFDWHMEHNPDQSIKGDMEIIAIGSTALLERDIQHQGALNMVSITSSERYARFVDPEKELKVVLKAMRQKPEDIMFTDEQVRENDKKAQEAGPPQDPQVMRAQAVVEAKKLDIADRQEQRQFDAQRLADEAALKRETLDYNRAREQEESRIAMTDMAINRDTTLLKLDHDRQLASDALQAKERLETLRIDNDRQLFNAEASLKTSLGSGI